MSEEVQRYYDGHAALEWERLARDRVEFAVTMRTLREYLPPAPAGLLDLGGGPGRYSVELARQGYRVTLADISQPELDFAADRAKESGVTLAATVRSDARDLAAFADKSFDAVVMMGPLYHLLDLADRERAIDEALRVLRPGGRVFTAFVTRTAVLRWWAKRDPMHVAADPARYEAHLQTGRVTENAEFTDMYLAHPLEIVPLMESRGAVTRDLVGVEGVVSMIRELINELEGDAWETWVDFNYRLGKDPSNHGCAEHLLYVGDRP